MLPTLPSVHVRQPKVDQSHFGRIFSVDADVLWLDITMQETDLMQGSNRFEDLSGN